MEGRRGFCLRFLTCVALGQRKFCYSLASVLAESGYALGSLREAAYVLCLELACGTNRGVDYMLYCCMYLTRRCAPTTVP